MPGFRAALQAGACWLETDVQITADGIAVLSHDPSVLKITGSDLLVTATDYETLRALPAGYPERFAERFRDLRITRLDEFIKLLKRWPKVKAFIEVKEASITTHGIAVAVDTILRIINPVLPQCILISFNYELLTHVRKFWSLPVGWVLYEWTAHSKDLAIDLEPDYLFCNQKRLPPGDTPLWQGPWQWAIYTINTVSEIPPLLKRGAELIETDSISRLLADPALVGRGSV